MRIRREDLQPGDCVSVDQYICHDIGRLPHTKGKEKDAMRYCGGLIAVDHSSGCSLRPSGLTLWWRNRQL